MRQRNYRKRGFTLIELLVAVSIIAVLISILVPSLSLARKQAKAAVCLANLHSWGQIWSIYTNDNDSHFSSGTQLGVSGGKAGWARGEWIVALRTLWDPQDDILMCPMATEPLLDPDSTPSDPYYPHYRYGGPFNTYRQGIWQSDVPGERCSYGMNLWLYDPPAGYKNKNGQLELQGRLLKDHWRTTDQHSPSRIPAFLDSMWRGGGPQYDTNDARPPDFNGQWLGTGREMMHFAIDRHHGKTHSLFLDFSVRPVGIKELWTFKWHKSFNSGYTSLFGGPPPDHFWPDWIEDLPL